MGSAVKILLETYPKLTIHGWEIDPDVIAIGRRFFWLEKIKNRRTREWVQELFLEWGLCGDAWFSCSSNQVAQVLLTLPCSFSQMGMLSGVILQVFYGLMGSWRFDFFSNFFDKSSVFFVWCSAGFETVTYMIQGSFTHQDFADHKGTIHAGDVQWMTAGRGIVHSEMPAAGGTQKGLQVWINLAFKDKMFFSVRK